jgi:hypothetical protein
MANKNVKRSIFQMDIKLFETSAKENINVEEMFRYKLSLR